MEGSFSNGWLSLNVVRLVRKGLYMYVVRAFLVSWNWVDLGSRLRYMVKPGNSARV